MKKFVFNVTGLDNSRSPSFFSIELFTNWGEQQSGKPTAVFDISFATKRRTAQPTKLTLDFEMELQKLLKIVQILMKGLFQPGQGQEGDGHAHASDQQGVGLKAEITAAELKGSGDGHHHAAHEIGNGGGDRGPEVGAELLGRHGDEDGPNS